MYTKIVFVISEYIRISQCRRRSKGVSYVCPVHVIIQHLYVSESPNAVAGHRVYGLKFLDQ